MEEIIFSLKHYWRFVDSEALDLTALSWGVEALHQKAGQNTDFVVNEGNLICF